MKNGKWTEPPNAGSGSCSANNDDFLHRAILKQRYWTVSRQRHQIDLLIVKGVLDISCTEQSISCECSSANHAGFTPLVLWHNTGCVKKVDVCCKNYGIIYVWTLNSDWGRSNQSTWYYYWLLLPPIWSFTFIKIWTVFHDSEWLNGL